VDAVLKLLEDPIGEVREVGSRRFLQLAAEGYLERWGRAPDPYRQAAHALASDPRFTTDFLHMLETGEGNEELLQTLGHLCLPSQLGPVLALAIEKAPPRERYQLARWLGALGHLPSCLRLLDGSRRRPGAVALGLALALRRIELEPELAEQLRRDPSWTVRTLLAGKMPLH
jgi:hypothetical protein